MDAILLQKLEEQGELKTLTTGLTGVPVSLQYEQRLTSGSFAERRAFLSTEFKKLSETLIPDGVEVHLGSISVLAQTVEALVPVAQYDSIEQKLKNQHIRVDPLITRQVV